MRDYPTSYFTNPIISSISGLLDLETVFTDIQVKANLKLFYKAPRGYFSYGDQYIEESDIAGLAKIVFPKDRLGIQLAEIKDAADLVQAFKAHLHLQGGQAEVVWQLGNARLRGNFFLYGSEPELGIAIRKQPAVVPPPRELGLCSPIQELALMHNQGLILISGPTGSGKSTTVACLLDIYSRAIAGHIVTVERPIEYIIAQQKAMVTQREVPTAVNSFVEGVQAAKRMQPNIIMVGEINDSDTADACLTAALSGHLVFGTLHNARRAADAIESLLTMLSQHTSRNSALELIANNLIAIQAQTLIPKKDGKGLFLGYEYIVNNPTVANAIRSASYNRIDNAVAQRDGSNLLNEILKDAILNGTISKEDAVIAAYDKTALINILKNNS